MESSLYLNPVERAKRYTVLLEKCCNPKDRPPKQKQIKNIIMATYQDEQLDGLMMALKDITRGTLNSVSCWKLHFTLHSVLREGSYSVENFKAVTAYFASKNIRFGPGDFYGANSGPYKNYLQSKTIFHQKCVNLKGNLTIRSGYTCCPYQAAGDSFSYLHNCIKYYESCICTLETIFMNIPSSTKMSASESGHNKLMPVYLLFEDCLGIFALFPELFATILNMLDNSYDLFIRYGEMFEKLYFKMITLVDIGLGISFLASLNHFPDLSDTSPIEKLLNEARNRQALIKDKTSELKIEKKQPTVQPIVQEPPKDLHVECVHKIKTLQITINRYEEKFRALQNDMEVVKSSAMEKYNNDMAFASKKLVLLQKENDLIRKEIEENQKAEQRSSDDRFNRLKEMYVELRNEYTSVNEKLTGLKSELTMEQSNKAQKDIKIAELKDEIEKLNIDLIRCASNMTTAEQELVKLKTQTSQGTQKFVQQLEQANRQVEILQQKYNTETSDLNNQLKDLKNKLDQGDMIKILIESLKNQFSAYKSTLHEPSSNNYQPSELVASIEKVSSNVEKIIDQKSLKIADLISFFNANNAELCQMVHFCKGVFKKAEDSEIEDSILEFSEKLIDDHCSLLDLLGSGSDYSKNKNEMQMTFHKIKVVLRSFAEIVESIPVVIEKPPSPRTSTPHAEIMKTQDTIEQAKILLQNILVQSKSVVHGKEVTVHAKIMDGCSELLDLIDQLVKESADLQHEIIEANAGCTKDPSEFYNKHHTWTEGLISAAQAVGGAAFFLVQTADRTISHDAPLEELIVASLDINASIAQLIASSRVKADIDSANLKKLVSTSSKVNGSSNGLVQQVSEIIKKRDSDFEFDLSNMSMTQTKRLEMNVQIKCLELESQLDRERAKLLHIRSKNFHSAKSVYRKE